MLGMPPVSKGFSVGVSAAVAAASSIRGMLVSIACILTGLIGGESQLAMWAAPSRLTSSVTKTSLSLDLRSSESSARVLGPKDDGRF
jgi:hypothetical protein